MQDRENQLIKLRTKLPGHAGSLRAAGDNCEEYPRVVSHQAGPGVEYQIGAIFGIPVDQGLSS